MKQTVEKFLKRSAASPKTTGAGIGTLVTLALAAYADPATLANPTTLAAIFAAIGLLFAKDQGGTPPTGAGRPAA